MEFNKNTVIKLLKALNRKTVEFEIVYKTGYSTVAETITAEKLALIKPQDIISLK